MSKTLKTILFLLVAISGASAQTEHSKQYVEPKHDSSTVEMPATKEIMISRHASYNKIELRRPQATVVIVGPRSTYLQEGLKLGAVLKVLGQPAAVSQRSENGKVIVSYEFTRGGGRTVVAEFVNDVLVHSQIVVADEVKRGVAG